jgi:hypothetical protein
MQLDLRAIEFSHDIGCGPVSQGNARSLWVFARYMKQWPER